MAWNYSCAAIEIVYNVIILYTYILLSYTMSQVYESRVLEYSSTLSLVLYYTRVLEYSSTRKLCFSGQLPEGLRIPFRYLIDNKRWNL